jgi:hypothetical protein
VKVIMLASHWIALSQEQRNVYACHVLIQDDTCALTLIDWNKAKALAKAHDIGLTK